MSYTSGMPSAPSAMPISSVQPAKEPGIMQTSAWYLQHRMGKACSVRLAKLSVEVEMDACVHRRQGRVANHADKKGRRV